MHKKPRWSSSESTAFTRPHGGKRRFSLAGICKAAWRRAPGRDVEPSEGGWRSVAWKNHTAVGFFFGSVVQWHPFLFPLSLFLGGCPIRSSPKRVPLFSSRVTEQLSLSFGVLGLADGSCRYPKAGMSFKHRAPPTNGYV